MSQHNKTVFLKYATGVGSTLWNIIKYYSYFHVGYNYVLPLRIAVCKGSSMEPTLKNNDIVLCENVSVKREKLKE